ncbi:MAG: sulfatase-like hydrolase/transferase [Desulfobacteraceae bacterium]|nr:sulfatase-like hydrolase/transferase [Desulfobacteraceae bacterium]
MEYLLISILFFVFSVLLEKYKLQSKKSALLSACIVFLYVNFCGVFVVSDYFTGEGINDAVIYHLIYGLAGAGFKEYSMIIGTGIFFFVFSIAASSVYYRRKSKRRHTDTHDRTKARVSTLLLLTAFMFNPTTTSLYAQFEAFDSVLEIADTATDTDEHLSALQEEFNRYYLQPKKNRVTQDRPNLIYIYAESLEQTYFDEQLFPGLVPNLKQLAAENTVFTNISQVCGDQYTIAGMTTTQCGTPLFSPSGWNSMGGMEHFYEGAYSIGKFLASDNYTLAYRGGASLEFAGKGKLYKTHGFTDVKGREELIPYLEDPGYVSWWGLHDDSLFDIVYDRFVELSKSKENFALFTLTLDTHHPNGHPTQSCENIKYKDGSIEILNAVACADHLISDFIRKVQASEYGKNTVIVLTSDHLAMRTGATSILRKGNRKDLFMIIDPGNEKPRAIAKEGSMVDVAATVLYSLGYDTPLGLGRNLQGDSESLIAGLENYESKLNQWKPIIEKFWNNPKIGGSFLVDEGAETIEINGTLYNYPVLIEVKDNLEIKPYFEFYELHNKLSSRILKFNASTPFIWVDKCSKISYWDESLKDRKGYCVAWGQLGSDVMVKHINGSMLLSTKILRERINNADSQENLANRLNQLKSFVYKNRYQDGWSKGKNAGVEITCLQEERVQLQYWTHNPKKDRYRVEIVLDGHILESSDIEPFVRNRKEFDLKAGRHEITLHIEDVFNPYLLKESVDNRNLGVSFVIDRL